jgi:hypothetical protein
MNRSLQDSPPLDEDTAAVMIAALRAINSGYPFEPLNRANLFDAAYGLINFLARTVKPDEPELIGKFAALNILLTKLLDQIVVNAPEKDDRLRILRTMAKVEPVWPTMMRPGDPEFSALKVEKLGVGTNCVIRRLEKDAKRPPSFKTPRNRLTARLLAKLLNSAQVISTTSDDEIALQHIRITVPEAQGERATRILPLLREINQKPVLTFKTVGHWNRWLSEFVIITDPEFERYPELQKVKSAKPSKLVKDPTAGLRSQLEKFFHPALILLAKQASLPLLEPLT